MNIIAERARQIAPEITEIRREIHRNAEHGFNLPLTVKLVTEKLTEWGYIPEHPCEGCVTAVVGDVSKGKVIMLRADMDALPIKEQSGLPFASVTEYSHCCGHDIHTAILLGAAKILKERESELKGAVKLVFQPAEELLRGAKLMIESGIMKNPEVNAAFAIHVDSDNPAGTYSFIKGRMMSAASEFIIDITGKGCHGGASVHLGVDPINVGVHIHLALQELIAREVPSLEPAVLSIGSFHAGTATNIIPDTAQMKGTVRSFAPEVQKHLLKRVVEVTEQTARVYNAEAKVTFITDIPSVDNNGQMIEHLVETIKQVNPEAIMKDRQTLGCEDFAFVGELVPAAFMKLGAAVENSDQRYPLHNGKIVFDEASIPLGIALHAAYAVGWLEK